MPTFTALTTLTARENAEALGLALEALEPEPTGVGVFEMEDGSGLWEVGAYFVDAPDEVGLALLAAAHSARPFVVSELPETDWVAHVNDIGDQTLRATCQSWYFGSNIPGKPRVILPYAGGFPAYTEKCDEVAAAGYTGFALR